MRLPHFARRYANSGVLRASNACRNGHSMRGRPPSQVQWWERRATDDHFPEDGAHVTAAANHLVNARMGKRQPMRWSAEGAQHVPADRCHWPGSASTTSLVTSSTTGSARSRNDHRLRPPA